MVAPPRLVVGLGNPGAAYAATRHNAGAWLAESLASHLGVDLRHESRYHGLVGQVRAAGAGGGLWLLVPQTFMNRSGQAVLALANFYRILPDSILVLHDELDLPPGTLRLKFGGGMGGHNGLKDINAHLGTQDFWRLRIGIGHPGEKSEVVDYVLTRASAAEDQSIRAAVAAAADVLPVLITEGPQRAMHRLHSKPADGE